MACKPRFGGVFWLYDSFVDNSLTHLRNSRSVWNSDLEQPGDTVAFFPKRNKQTKNPQQQKTSQHQPFLSTQQFCISYCMDFIWKWIFYSLHSIILQKEFQSIYNIEPQSNSFTLWLLTIRILTASQFSSMVIMCTALERRGSSSVPTRTFSWHFHVSSS